MTTLSIEPLGRSGIASPRSIAALVLSLVAAFSAASMGFVFMPDGWYEQLAKPPLNPPNWIFGPVWTALYLTMAVAAWLAWQGATSRARSAALAIYVVQLLLNAAWTELFFGLHSLGGSLIDIAALWLAIVATIAILARVSSLAAWMLVPYLAWVSFAGYLNLALYRLNS